MDKNKENKEDGVSYCGEGPINIQNLSKNEIIISQSKEMQIYKVNKKSVTKQLRLKTEKEIIYLIVKDNKLIVSLKNGEIIILKKNGHNNYSKLKSMKFLKLKFKSLLDLKENNLICGFTYHSLYIIDINNASIISKFIFHNKMKKEQNTKGDEEIDENEEDESYQDEDDINIGDTLHEGSHPFLLKNPKSNNYFLCFKQVSYYTIFDYKKSKIIKKVNIDKKLCFQIYKPKDVYNYFFVII